MSKNQAICHKPVDHPLNSIQSHLYRYYILHNFLMEKGKYRQVFMRTHPKYRGLLYHRLEGAGDTQQVDE
jgi:hypothetical protein